MCYGSGALLMGIVASRAKPAGILIGITLAAGLCILLAQFQWMELIVMLQGGESFCSINETLNCDAVWSSPFARLVHERTLLPVAGWGLVWGATAFATSLGLWLAAVRGQGIELAACAARVTGLVGVATSAVLFAMSWQLGAFCPTCLLTYLSVIAFTVLVFRVAPLSSGLFRGASRALRVPVAVAIASYLLLLFPAARTPLEPQNHLPRGLAAASANAPSSAAPGANASADVSPLARYLAALPPKALQAVSDALDAMRHSPVVDLSRYPVRQRTGPANARVKIVEFVDLKCSHCKRLDEALEEIRQSVPPDAFSSEARYYPLDSACNAHLGGPPGAADNVRCVSAKALICVEQRPEFEALRKRMFAEQTVLTTERVYELATEVAGLSSAELRACVDSNATADKLAEDVAYASNFPVEGTPIVLVDGRLGSNLAPFLLAVILADGNLDHAAFGELPPPRHDAPGHEHEH
jgi:protein-disulfide isomerase/uncharacterized membrane protein